MTLAADFAAKANQVVNGGAVDPGFMMQAIYTSAPTGWLKMNGTSVGNASSGATGRANADTAALFAALWNNVAQVDAPVQDSAGSTVSRGANAAADFAANRRIVIPDMRGEFSRGLDDGRGVDTGRVNGSAQAQDIQAHVHTWGAIQGQGFSGGNSIYAGAGPGGANTSSTGGAETRPRTRAWNWFIKL